MNHTSVEKKIIPFSALETVSQNARDGGKQKKVLVGGCFDIFHYGHLRFLKEAKKQGDYLIILLESDAFIEQKKNRKPVHTQQQRAEILSSLEMVDAVVLLPLLKNDEDYFKITQTLHPEVLAVTEGDPHLDLKKQQAASVGAILYIITLVPQFSSSNILSYASISRD